LRFSCLAAVGTERLMTGLLAQAAFIAKNAMPIRRRRGTFRSEKRKTAVDPLLC